MSFKLFPRDCLNQRPRPNLFGDDLKEISELITGVKIRKINYLKIPVLVLSQPT